MFRTALAIPAILATLALAGCGNASFTVKDTFKGSSGTETLYLVISGDPNTIAAEKAGAPAGSASDGDTHAGSQVCETDITDKGNSFHVVAYSTTPLPSGTCDSFKNGING
jgi:hypothetical protein